jgi:hypothetical protein
LTRLTNLIAQNHANILHIIHERAAKDIPIGTVFRGALYYIPTYIIANVILMLSPYWTVLVLSDLVR